MSAPTQVYPPWLTPVPETIYDQDGAPISTSTTILYLPLTYYGPSVPLGPEWTYGGLTPPASTSTVIISTTVTPSTSTPTATPSSISTASSSSVAMTFSSSSSLSQPLSSTTSSTATPSPSKHAPLSHNQLIGVIVGAVIGALVIFLALFVCFLLIKNRRHEQRVRFRNVLDIDHDYIVVDPDTRAPGDGSPRQSGEERDSLLQAHGDTPDPGSTPRYQKTTQRGIPVVQPIAGPSAQPVPQIPTELGAHPVAPHVPRLPADTHSSGNSRGSGSSTEMSSLGSVIQNSRLSALSPLVEEQHEMHRAAVAARLRGPILSPQDQRRVEEETHPESNIKDSSQQDEGGQVLSPLPPPPRSADPENTPPRLVSQGSSSLNSPQIRTALVPHFQPNVKPHDSYGSSKRSSSPTDPEDVALLTARRVKPVDWGARAAPYYYSPLSDRQNNSTSGGIMSSISNRLSWFKNLDALPISGSLNRRSGPSKNFKPSDNDTEAGNMLLNPAGSNSPDPQSPYMGQQQTQQTAESNQPLMIRFRPHDGIELDPGPRPLSGISGRSAGSSADATTYFDARSSFPNTPSLTPLPRAMTPAPGTLGGQASRESNWRLPSPLSVGVSSSSLQAESEQALRAPVEFGSMNSDIASVYDENDTITRQHAREIGVGSTRIDVLDLPAPSALSTFRNTGVSGAVPLAALASTSTAFSIADTLASASAPTLFTLREGSPSTSTSELSLRDSSKEMYGTGASSTVGESNRDSGNGSPGTETTANMVHVDQTSAETFIVKEAKLWSEGSGEGYDTVQGTKATTYHDTATFLHFNSRETNATNMTGTTLATIGEDASTTAVTIDLLEDEPPLPGEGWRSLAGVVGDESTGMVQDAANRRFTLGTPMPHRQVQHDITLAEFGSLHSVRSHLSPGSSHRSTDAAPRDISESIGSRSSRPSAQHSLAYSGSLSSFEERRQYSSLRYSVYSGYSGRDGSSSNSNGGTISPTLSAFGSLVRPTPRNLSPLSEQFAVESRTSYYTAHDTISGRSTSGMQDMPGTSRSGSTAQTGLMEVEEDVVDAARAAMSSNGHDQEFGLLNSRSPTGDLDGSLRLSNAPWAAGLDQNWTPL